MHLILYASYLANKKSNLSVKFPAKVKCSFYKSRLLENETVNSTFHAF